MKKYDSYKKVTSLWLTESPSHWEESRLKFAATIKNGYAFKSENFIDEGVPVVRIGDIKPPNIDLTNAKCVTKEESDSLEEYYIKQNDILLAMTGATIGKTASYNADGKALLNQRVGLLRAKRNMDQGFLNHLLNIEAFGQYIQLECGGSAQENIGKTELNEFHLFIPPLEEQIQIANYLNHKTTQIDDLIRKKEKLIELLKEERTAIINQVVTKGLDPNVPMKDSGIEWLGEIPEHWDLTRIKYVGSIVSGYSFKSDDFTEEGVRVMKISNIQTMRVDWTDDSYLPTEFLNKYGRFRINKGDLVFALTRPIISTGIKAAIVQDQEEILLNQRNAVLKPTDKLDVYWMYYMIYNESFKEHFESLIDSTGQQPNISSTDIANINIPLPSASEQKEIIEWLNLQGERIDMTIGNTSKEIELLKEYKTALISEVVTGKVDVRNEVIA